MRRKNLRMLAGAAGAIGVVVAVTVVAVVYARRGGENDTCASGCAASDAALTGTPGVAPGSLDVHTATPTIGATTTPAAGLAGPQGGDDDAAPGAGTAADSDAPDDGDSAAAADATADAAHAAADAASGSGLGATDPAEGGEAPVAPADDDATPAPSAAPTPQPTPPPGTGSGGDCANCGNPRFFCDTGGWAFCDDYRDLTSTADVAFPAGRAYSLDCLSSSDPGYAPSNDYAGSPCGISKVEHFMTQIDDGDFGEAVLRVQQPIDISQERRIHFETDLKTGARRYTRLLISPQLTKAITDDRGEPNIESPIDGVNLWFVGGPCSSPTGLCAKQNAFVVRGGNIISDICCGQEVAGQDNVRNVVDVYVSRTRLRVVVDGGTVLDTGMPDAGFDVGYLYLAQASYNPCKDGQCGAALQRFHWDNVAFDGPALPRNGMTPAGYQDVAFNAYSQGSCTVKGYPAALQSMGTDLMWKTWVARMPTQSVSPADVSCSGGYRGDLWNGVPEGFEVVAQ